MLSFFLSDFLQKDLIAESNAYALLFGIGWAGARVEEANGGGV